MRPRHYLFLLCVLFSWYLVFYQSFIISRCRFNQASHALRNCLVHSLYVHTAPTCSLFTACLIHSAEHLAGFVDFLNSFVFGSVSVLWHRLPLRNFYDWPVVIFCLTPHTLTLAIPSLFWRCCQLSCLSCRCRGTVCNAHQNLQPDYSSQFCSLSDHIRLFVYWFCCCAVALPALWTFCLFSHAVVFGFGTVASVLHAYTVGRT